MNNGNMAPVSKNAFFAAIGKLNVHPYIVSQKYDPVLGYKSHWKTPSGNVVGISVGIDCLENQEYWLATDCIGPKERAE